MSPPVDAPAPDSMDGLIMLKYQNSGRLIPRIQTYPVMVTAARRHFPVLKHKRFRLFTDPLPYFNNADAEITEHFFDVVMPFVRTVNIKVDQPEPHRLQPSVVLNAPSRLLRALDATSATRSSRADGVEEEPMSFLALKSLRYSTSREVREPSTPDQFITFNTLRFPFLARGWKGLKEHAFQEDQTLADQLKEFALAYIKTTGFRAGDFPQSKRRRNSARPHVQTFIQKLKNHDDLCRAIGPLSGVRLGNKILDLEASVLYILQISSLRTENRGANQREASD